MFHEYLREKHQNAVAHIMTVDIVYKLKRIKIYHAQSTGFIHTHRCNALSRGSLVKESSKRIAGSLFGDRCDLAVIIDDMHYALSQDLGIKRLTHKIGHPHLEAALFYGPVFVGSQEDNGCLGIPLFFFIFTDPGKRLESVHLRHQNIQQNYIGHAVVFYIFKQDLSGLKCRDPHPMTT